MSLYKYIISFICTILLLSCNRKAINTKTSAVPNISVVGTSISDTKKNPVDYLKNYNNEDNKLFVFVGEKLSLEALPYIEGSMDAGFKAKYKVLERVFGNFSEDTIEFVAYDHYGLPEFSKFNNVLLFVSASKGTYYHQKYMFNDVYKTNDGRWAGPYEEQDYKHELNKKTKIKPELIKFANEVSYPLKYTSEDSLFVLSHYPKPYFKIEGKNAIVVFGNYVQELFILKRDGYLTAREIFKDGKLQ